MNIRTDKNAQENKSSPSEKVILQAHLKRAIHELF